MLSPMELTCLNGIAIGMRCQNQILLADLPCWQSASSTRARKSPPCIQAVPILRQRYPDIDVRIVGGGFEWEKLQVAYP